MQKVKHRERDAETAQAERREAVAAGAHKLVAQRQKIELRHGVLHAGVVAARDGRLLPQRPRVRGHDGDQVGGGHAHGYQTLVS